MPNRWIVTCPENHITCQLELWRIWQRENCVAIGWPPENGYRLEQPHHGWPEEVRSWVRQVQPGDTVIPFLMRHRLGIPGDVVRTAITDAQWQPTVPAACLDKNPTGVPELGRRIIVEWWRDGMPGERVVLIPLNERPRGGGLALKTIVRID